ncbi:MAG: acyclic terpene utilization AtuA family protein [Clostridia bacterium]|nr:acyclic terpene utilization AtuA family protein [Clostridia bacterium]MBN2884097.1 acyclic terpene utilization AtuA family protein [Clostridia bacterium]
MRKIKVLSPTAILGYGFPEESFEAGLALLPDVIAVDAGSTDPGPYYLGAGIPFTDRDAVKRDLAIITKGALKCNIPLIIGTAGGSGGNSHLEWCLEIEKEVLSELGNARLAVISAHIDKERVLGNIKNGETEPLAFVPALTEKDVEDATEIVAQMGMEPIIRALENGADIIMAGRCYDPAVFAALPVMKGYPTGLALHMGKILECAAIAADPGSGSDCMMGVLDDNGFEVFPLNPIRRCTEMSVAAHTLYEKSNPYLLHGPDGIIDLKECSFKQIDDITVRVEGTGFIKSEKPMVKIEGARLAGFRTISIAGIRDPIMIDGIDVILEYVRETAEQRYGAADNYILNFRIYGKNGVMGDNEPVEGTLSHELGLIIDVVAMDRKLSESVCSFSRSTLLHYGYPGRISTAGNLAFPYSPSDIKAGAVYEFCVYHLIPMEAKMFPMEILEV